jgi:ankyrin repeat protein
VFYLVEKGAVVDEKNIDGRTPLYFAGADLDVIKLLVEKGADINAQDKYSRPILEPAVFGGRFNTNNVDYLIEKGINIPKPDSEIDQPMFFRTLERGQKNIFDAMVKQGYDVFCKDAGGFSILLKAAMNNMKEMIDFLISRGAEIKTADKTGKTALHHAVIREYYELTKYLLSKGFDVNDADREGLTPYYYASRFGHKKLAQLLAPNGARQINLSDKFDAVTLLNKPVAEKEAYVWYFGSLGWAVKTKNNLLIFDFYQYGDYKNDKVKFAIPHNIGDQFHYKNSKMEGIK